MKTHQKDKLEEEIDEKVSMLSASDWTELERLYNLVINHHGSFSRMGGGERIEPGVISMPFTIEKPIVSDVRKFLLDKHLIVMFDWSHWDEGKAMFRVDENERFKNISQVDVLKLFTAVMRNDRFSDGAWADMFENGDGKRLMSRLLEFKPHNLSHHKS